MFGFARYCQIVLSCGCTSLPSHRQSVRVLVIPYPILASQTIGIVIPLNFNHSGSDSPLFNKTNWDITWQEKAMSVLSEALRELGMVLPC